MHPLEYSFKSSGNLNRSKSIIVPFNFSLFVFASAQQETSESFSAILPASQSVSHAFYIIQFCIMLRLLQRMDTANFGCTTNDNCKNNFHGQIII